MRLSERAQEILETLWISTVEEKKAPPAVGLSEREEAMEELAKGTYVDVASGRVTLKEKGRKEGARVVCKLKDLDVGDRGKISYLATDDAGRLNRLMAMGALPGISVTLTQKFPSYVFRIGESQFAVDRDMAEGIYIRAEEG